MSIGEYYKMLMEGKRPTRQRTHKDDVTPIHHIPQTPLVKPKKQEKEQEQKSEREDKQQVMDELDVIKKRQEKLILKEKRKFSKQEIKTKLSSREEIKVEKPVQQLPREEQLPRVAKKVLGPESVKPKIVAPKEVRNVGKDSSGLTGRESEKEEVKATDKFESIYPYPFLAENRLALISNDEHQLGEIIEYDEYRFSMKTQEEHPISLREELVSVLGKPFVCKLQHLQQVPDEVASMFSKKDQENVELIVSQLMEQQDTKYAENDKYNLHFVTFIPQRNLFETQIVRITIKESVPLYKDLIEFDAKEFNQHEKAYGSNFHTMLQLGQKLNDSYNGYQQRVSAVQLTPQNMEDLLFSACSYDIIQDNGESGRMNSKSKKGILLRVKYDNYYQDYMLLMRFMQVKANQKERIEWIQLSKYRVRSDLTKGFVSIYYLQTLDNYPMFTQKLKLRNIPRVSYFESMKQKQSLRKYYQEDGEEIRKAIISKENNKDRCVYCNYITQEIEHLKCSNCQKVYHEQCLHNQYESCLGIRETNWRCPDCLRCTNCLSIRNRQSMLICQCCNSPFHYECLDQSIKLAIPSLGQTDKAGELGSASKSQVTVKSNTLQELDFKCEHCVYCENCGAKEAGKNRLNKWSKDFKLCSNCNKKRKNKEYCPICERFWPESIDQQAVKSIKPVEINEDTQMIEENSDLSQRIPCNSCGMHLHLSCDRMFQDEGVRKKFNDLKLQFNCQSCRQQQRSQLIQQLVERLSNEDKMFFFQEPVEDHVPNYTKIVKTPMCFKYIRQKIGTTYLRNPEQLRSDCALIFNNAMVFNLPKTKVHREAQRLNDICSQIIQSIWSTLERNKLRTMDEDLHLLKVKDSIKNQKNTNSPPMIQEQQPEYSMKPDDLFELGEHMPVSGKTFLNERDLEISDYQEEDSADYLEGGPNSVTGQSSSHQAGISKNLRTRKHINYNEDKLLQGSTDALALAGAKRALKSLPSLDDDILSISKGAIKRVKGQQDPDFQAPYQPLKNLTVQHSAQDLLSQALYQSKQFDQQSVQSEPREVDSSQTLVQQQQQMMMNYYQEIDDEKCYYSNPMRCSFDDPSLMFEEMCYLCGAFGNREDFLCCTLCGESFHTYCLTLPHDDISKFQSYWKCLNCKFCEVCASATQEAFLLYCDVCDKAFHSFCLKPKLKSIPNCGWKCQECFACSKCGTKSFFSPEDAEQQKNLEVNDFQFSNNFSYCYQCGQNEYKKSFCNICKQKNEFDNLADKLDDVKRRSSMQSFSDSKLRQKARSNHMLKCITCGFYSHLKCSKVTPETLSEIENEVETMQNGQKPNVYKCLDCIMNGKTINHLIQENCEHYENIHQIISRQKLLSQLCQDILQSYFPIQEKAPLFIKSFIDQNQDFFKSDSVINDWLLLLECNVCFETDTMPLLDNAQEQDAKKDEDMQIDEQQIEKQSKEERKKVFWERVTQREVNSTNQRTDSTGRKVSQPFMESLDHSLVQEYQKPLWSLKDSNKIMNPDKRDFSEESIVRKAIGSSCDAKQILGADDTNHIIVHARSIIRDNRLGNVTYKKWEDVKFDDVEGKSIKEIKEIVQERSNGNTTKAQKVSQALFGHKEGFLPQKRNFYKSLYDNNLHRFGQRELFMQPEDIQSMITVPTEENLSKVNFAELYVKKEFKAVMKIKMQFFKWFEDLIKSILKNNQKFLRKEKRKQMFRDDYSKNSADDIQMTNQEAFPDNELLRQQLIQDLDDAMNNDEDLVKDNPQSKLSCVLCRKKGEYRITGRLIPYQINQFVHTNCAFWSTDVHETEDGQLVNFFFVQNGKSKYTKCLVCGETGASIFCFTRKCHAAFHFPCAYNSQRVAFLRSKETYCDACARLRELKLGYIKEFNTHRRMYIVKNHQPWNTIFQYQMTQQLSQMQQYITNSGPDADKPFQIEKWRPYYYDMFNRVGNLTVLSLKKEINQIIEDSYTKSGQLMLHNDSQSQISDFATLRIYWKFYIDSAMSIEDDNAVQPLNLRKGYFLYSNNQIKEVTKANLNYIMSHAYEKIRDKIHIHSSYQHNLGEIANYNQATFWTKIMSHFQKERPNFSLQNIEFSIQEFAGKTKYPISIWNRAEIKNKQFFLKSGYQMLLSQHQDERDCQGNALLSRKNEGLSLDDVFKNMFKINQCNENQNSSKRYTTSKHMSYEQLSQILGKKYFFLKFNKQADKNQEKTSKLNKKLRITDTIDTNKEIDLPIAMKYRLSKTQPKRVEVGPSKIHRNGLFTLEDLMPGDIVIEYVGEMIRNKVADKREEVYNMKGIGDCYLFRLDKEYIIDATFFGNKARYLNHSCDANCSAKIINVQGLKHIIISANRSIKSGEELTYNYNFDIEADKIECYCGAPTCLGRLN